MAAPRPSNVNNTGQGRTSTRCPSYEDANRPGQNQFAKCIIWTLDGPLTEAISVMRNPFFDEMATPEPYFIGGPASNNAATNQWHPVSREPVTEQPISSIRVSITALEDLEWSWLEAHRHHHDPDEAGGDPAEFRFGRLADYDPKEDEEQPHLLNCCRCDCPRNKGGEVSITAEGDLITIHEYLSAVHLRLMSARDDILQFMSLTNGEPWPASSKLIATYSPTDVLVRDKADWLAAMRTANLMQTANLNPYRNIGGPPLQRGALPPQTNGLAPAGDGWFLVEYPDGRKLFTRDKEEAKRISKELVPNIPPPYADPNWR